MRVQVLFAHPRSDRSEVNTALAAAARSLPYVTFVDLYAEYPDFDIDVDREQDRLLGHDVVVFQHPVYWYSCPALLKEWQDLVLEHGFAYGSQGRALTGKILMNVVTCGARRETYGYSGANGHELRDFFLPFEKTAHLCRMRWLPPFAVFAAGHALEEGRLEGQVAAYRCLLTALAENRIDLVRAERVNLLSEDLDRLIWPAAPAAEVA